MGRRLAVVALCGLAVGGFALAAEGDWPQWRGPNRDGVAVGAKLPDRLPASLAKVWELEVGAGYSGPVVSGSMVVLFSRQGDSEVIQCVSASDGKPLWKDSYAAPYTPASVAARHGKGPFATPTIAGARVFAFGISGILSCHELQGGKLLWRHDFKDKFKKTYPSWGASCSPLVEGGLCIVGIGAKSEGGLAAFDVETGKVVWTQASDGASYSSPIAADLGGRRQLVALMEHHLLAVEQKQGDVLWQTPLATKYEQNAITPTALRDKVIIAGYGEPTVAWRVVAREGKLAASEVWRNDAEQFYMSTPVLAGGCLLGLASRGGGTLVCINAEDGKTAWAGPRGLGEYASLVAAGDKALVLTTKGELLMLAASPKEFVELGRVRLTQRPTWAHMAVAGTRIYIKDSSHLACFQLTAP